MTQAEFRRDIISELDKKMVEVGHFPYLNEFARDEDLVKLMGSTFSMEATKKEKLKCMGGRYSSRLSTVLWQENYLTYVPLGEYDYALSWEFSGCYMARFRYQGKNMPVIYIHTGQRIT